MRNNIKSSTYYSITSYFHEMNPIIKIICSLIFTLIICLAKTVWLNLILLVLLFINILITNIPVKVYLNIIKKSLFFIIVIFLIDYLLKVSLNTNILICIKFLEVIIYASLVSITTKPLHIVKSLNIMFSPLKLIGVPVYYISFFILFVFQYIANIFDISKIINKSQKSNGNLNIIKKLRYKAIPLFVIDYKNNKKLKNSMSIKIYDLKWQKNHSMKFRFTMYDFSIILLYVFVLVLTFFEEV